MTSTSVARYFTDENTLGLGKLMQRSGEAMSYAPGTMTFRRYRSAMEPVVAQRNLLVITRDRRIRTRPAELRVYWEYGIRSVFGAKRDLAPRDQLELFLQHEERRRRAIIKYGAGPWALAMSPSGLRPLRLRGLADPGAASE